jgi:uncharacterized membrane protein
MKRNTRDLFFQVGKDIKSISILIALAGAICGKMLIWNHLGDVNNDIDYRELLSVMIGVLTTIVVTTYSLTIVALQLASVQFSPRILRSFFTEDRFNQVVLGTFIGEITYLMLLKTWAPRTLDIPIVLGLLLAVLLICIVFPLFIAHIADCINAGSIVRRIAFNILDEIDKHYGTTAVCAADFPIAQKPILPSENIIQLFSTQSGYIESVDYQQFELFFQQIKKIAAAKNITITALFQTASAGEFVAEGIALFALTSEEKDTKKRSELEAFLIENKAIQAQLHRIVKVEKYRSYKQDINFGIRQLVDIAIKAISPAVNDPTTCINSLDYLGMVLRRLVQCPPQCLAHQTFPPYLHAKEFGFREYIDHAFDQIYHFGKSDFIVVCRVLRTLRSVTEVADYQSYITILKAEYEDIKADILKQESNFTKEGFMKIKRELEACEAAF